MKLLTLSIIVALALGSVAHLPTPGCHVTVNCPKPPPTR